MSRRSGLPQPHSAEPQPAFGPRMLQTFGYKRLYARFSGSTMLPRRRFVANLQLVEQVLKEPALESGCIVECGTWRGGMAAALTRICGRNRDYFFFDSFEGLPPVTSEDGAEAAKWQADASNPRYFDNCAASREEFEETLRIANPDWKRVHIFEGMFVNSFPRAEVPPIAVLRLDVDWYQSTLQCLEKFWDRLLPGALVIFDDYFDWEGNRKAVHAFLAGRMAREAIRQGPSRDFAYLIRMPPAEAGDPGAAERHGPA